ncbi:MAG: hypothetical protein K8R54_10280 [Bacteroidales bacterium]|nr:hypothetical protein [Bacteroidales bacterium]
MNIPIDRNILSEIIKYELNSLSDFWNKKELLESPIEEMVFEYLYKFKNENAELIPQKTIKTISGNFRPDIILKNGEKEISIECDGEEFHKDDYYDEWRDTLILVSSKIQSIFRLRGNDIYTDLNNIIYFIANKEPNFFNMDMINRLKSSIRSEFINRDDIHDCVVKNRIVYDDYGLNGDLVKRMIEITWRNLSKSFDRFCIREILISYLNPGKTIDELKNLTKKKYIETEDLFTMFYDKYPEYNAK